MLALIKTAIGTKFVARWSDLMCSLALKAVRTVTEGGEITQSVGGVQTINGMTTIDIKRYARVEKVPGGTIEESQVLSGVLINKDITHPKMRRRIANPRIILLDCPLEYKKGESQTNIEISKEEDWARILEIEEEQIKKMCERLIEFKPDLVITEKGVSGSLSLFLARICTNISIMNRPCAALSPQSKRHRSPSRTQIGQQPHCTRDRSDDRQSRRGPTRLGRRYQMRNVLY
jgi:T-complex protein 1 subunit gamma